MDSTGEKSLSEDNWVWSPQGLVAMHYPEMWGLVQFSEIPVTGAEVAFVAPDDLETRWAMRRLYYAEREFEAAHRRFTADLRELRIPDARPSGYRWPPTVHASERSFTATTISTDGSRMLSIGAEGRLTSFKRTAGGAWK
jgi:hypothetical protein